MFSPDRKTFVFPILCAALLSACASETDLDQDWCLDAGIAETAEGEWKVAFIDLSAASASTIALYRDTEVTDGWGAPSQWIQSADFDEGRQRFIESGIHPAGTVYTDEEGMVLYRSPPTQDSLQALCASIPAQAKLILLKPTAAPDESN
ncbi:hypothetical protein [Qipengyuania nanhaisediminis]|uniref:Lipoprotein n=1 Tax=Qipengyuania nanhaisediminis TaxID=604088 RepID=A0A1I5Q3D4_9SPHN|nr:hypothetical protein [Qipengyuania nanhaisediminis]SFP40481.1 hypothetical protein SAMN04488060_2718 [Qipengyuania nanhaisediminis]